MSTLSNIFESYSGSLKFSRGKYDDAYRSRAKNAAIFYDDFLNKLICQFHPAFSSQMARAALHRDIEAFFGSEKLDFVAIDGTCAKDTFQDFVVFSACAYGAKGQVALSEDPPQIRYQRWTMEKDVSMVAYMPVPFVEFADIVDPRYQEESFCASESERVDMARIETRMMELAEIYLAYNVATSSSIESPKVILLDRSLSGMFADLALSARDVPMVGYPFDGRGLTYQDAVIALAHPFNESAKIPSLKRFRRHTAFIAAAHFQKSQELDLKALAKAHGMAISDLHEAVERITKDEPIAVESEIATLRFHTSLNASWDYSVRLFQSICKKLFMDKDQTALLYESPDEDGVLRQRWMSPDDLRFLIGVGLRALVEECWCRGIMLIGITKDSSSAYFSRNYLGVMKELAFLAKGGYPDLAELSVAPLPWTDRMLLEFLPHADSELKAPWSTVEFDSTFMTVRVVQEADGRRRIRGGYADAVAQENLFAKSLAQFFLSRSKGEPMAGHVVFVDRLLHPMLDSQLMHNLPIASPAIGNLLAFSQATNAVPNNSQSMMMYILDVLTRNLYPEMIGYPDPLHKADWGAKTVGRKMKDIIASSTFSFRANPLAKTARSIRDERGRR
ncbi:MAG: hypothetical protein KIT74_01395 [Fimbriimonadales bacterium]|nr:hypothetical protein [Fimbriimonadales bacterium]